MNYYGWANGAQMVSQLNEDSKGDCLLHADNRPWGLRAGFTIRPGRYYDLFKKVASVEKRAFIVFGARGNAQHTHGLFSVMELKSLVIIFGVDASRYGD
ncbi:hypothetical protein CDAR_275021 [Caerostris darwini]|uniref:Uncharacterized protein n=1 Tax=Caerostris darwini TaxID=1538125 RepID=A0AAV4UEU5_9ARAC|nr:hypothetical protein CDAR_275021 [Caerostris darwini]